VVKDAMKTLVLVSSGRNRGSSDHPSCKMSGVKMWKS
jgi:hypothetical protein